jgi:hypothetical protein
LSQPYLFRSGPISSHCHSFSFLSPYPLCSSVSPASVKTGVKARWVLGYVMAELLHGAGRRLHPHLTVREMPPLLLCLGLTPLSSRVRARLHRHLIQARLHRYCTSELDSIAAASGLNSNAIARPGSTPPPPHLGSTPPPLRPGLTPTPLLIWARLHRMSRLNSTAATSGLDSNAVAR